MECGRPLPPASLGLGEPQLSPYRSVIAGVFAPAFLAVHACVDDGQGLAEEDMVDAQARIALPTLSPVVPEGEQLVLRAIRRLERIRPALGQDLGKGLACFGLQQCVVAPGV